MSLFDTGEMKPALEREREGGWLVWVVVAALVLLVAGGYAGAYAVAGEKVPRGTTVSGVDIGGMEGGEALAVLESGLDERIDEPVVVEVEERSARVSPAEAGLEVDLEESVAEAGGERSWSPARLWTYFTGGDDRDAVVTVDAAAMSEAIERLEGRTGEPARDGRFRFDGDRPREVDPVVGRGFDREAAEQELVAAYLDSLSGDERPARLELVDIEPEIDEAAMREARESFVNPAMSGPVTLRFGKSDVRLQPREYVRALRLTPQDGRLVPGVDEKRMQQIVDSATTDGDPVDATVRLVNGKPKVVPGKPGVSYDLDEVSEAFLGAVTASGADRRAKIEGESSAPEFTTKDARALQIKEKVSEFTTHYPHAEYRNVNIGRAARLINGTVLKPGETFSLNGIVGERTAENGFTRGYIIDNGILRQDYGGGVSQIATTTFNAMFFAGLKDVEHKPHSFYIDRYPVGREATVAWPSLDLKFQNDTPYGVLIEAFIKPSTYSSQGSVTVRMYSTKHWNITTRTGERHNYRAPATRTLPAGPGCEPHTGWSGFDIDVWRYFRKPGSSEVVKTEKFHTKYSASDSVVCRSPQEQGERSGGRNRN